MADIKTDPEMVKLATQLIDRQTSRYDPADMEDRYETRLRAMIDAKLKGEGIDDETAPQPVQTNVIDLMAALRRSLGDDEPAKPAAKAKAGKATAPAAKAPRKRAS